MASDKTETRTASSTGGEKGVKLARFELLPTGPLQELASRFGLGAMKYDHRNWERGYEWSKSFGALMRHAQAFWSGEEDDDLGEEAFRAAGLDPEDFKVDGRIPGSSHLAAVAFHALALLEWSATHPEFDDRVSTEASRKEHALETKEGLSLEIPLLEVPEEFIQLVFGAPLFTPEMRAAIDKTEWVSPAPNLSQSTDHPDAPSEAKARHQAAINDWHNRPKSDDIRVVPGPPATPTDRIKAEANYNLSKLLAQPGLQLNFLPTQRVDGWLKTYGIELIEGNLGRDPYEKIHEIEFLMRLKHGGIKLEKSGVANALDIQ